MVISNPSFLILFVIVLPAWVFLWRREEVYQKRLGLIRTNIVHGSSARRRRFRLILWGIICSLVVVALARPLWGTEIAIVESQGVSVVFVLDVSTSMDSQDILPSRIDRAKVSLSELIHQLNGNELALILFAGEAVVQFPITTDDFSAVDFLRNVSTNSVAVKGTNMADALRLALLTLTAASKSQHVVVLLTDGEAHDGDLTPVLDAAVQSNTPIYTIGYGDVTGVTIPIYNPDGSILDKADSSGNPIISSLDEATLQMIANYTGGVYQRAANTGTETAILMQAINQYQPQTLVRGVQTRPIERFDIFIAIALILLAIETILSSSHRQGAKI